MKIEDTIWFCAGHGNVGIVKVRTHGGEVKYFIGQCKGEDEGMDKMWIADWGSSFPTEAGKVLFGD